MVKNIIMLNARGQPSPKSKNEYSENAKGVENALTARGDGLKLIGETIKGCAHYIRFVK